MAVAWCCTTPGVAAAQNGSHSDLAGGYYTSYTVKADGTVWSWGDDSQGELGDDATHADKSTPVQVSGLTNITSVAAGVTHALALRADGTVWAWGSDSFGELGDDATLMPKPTPVQVSGLTNIVSIAANQSHSLALRADGTVWSWGDDTYGQLGNDAALTQQPTPVQVAGLTNISSIAAGAYHSLALRADGTVWSWGFDAAGQLGNDAALTQQPTPVQVASLTNISSISAGFYHSVALRADGTVWSWGWDAKGQLGNDAALASQPTPVQTASLTNITSVATNYNTTFGRRADGTVWSWGDDSTGELGNDAALTNQPTPVQVSGLTNAASIAAGASHGLARRADGTLWSWGSDSHGQLGNNAALTDTATPVAVSWSVPKRFSQVAAGYYTSYALRSDGTVWSWGSDDKGQLGNDAALVAQSTPVQVSGLTNVVRIAAGEWNGLAITANGTLWTWGDDSYGQLGNDAALTGQPLPVQVSGLTNVVGASAGRGHALAVRADGTAWSWGDDNNGGLGNDATHANQPTPVQVSGLANAVSIAAGQSDWSLALLASGVAWSWGNDTHGQLGNDAALADKPTPVQVSGLTNLTSIATPTQFGQARRADGTAWSWGDDTYGTLGNDAALVSQPTPVQVSGLTNLASVAGSTYWHSFGLRADGVAWSWGRNNAGQLGDATTVDKPTPVQVSVLANVLAIIGGSYHSLAVRADGTVWHWGDSGSSPIQMQMLLSPPTRALTTLDWDVSDGYRLRLDWTAPTTNPDSYNIRSSADAYASVVANVSTLTKTITALTANTTYTYMVCAVYNGEPPDLCTSAVSATTTPAPPATSTTSNITETGMDVDWPDVSGATQYSIRLFADAACTSPVDAGSATTPSAYSYSAQFLPDTFATYQITSLTAGGLRGAPSTCMKISSASNRTAISVSITSGASQNLGSGAPGASLTSGASSIIQVGTRHSTSYSLMARLDHNPQNGAYTIPPVANGGTAAAPALWGSATGFGIGVRGAGADARWSAGPKWTGLTTTDQAINTTTGLNGDDAQETTTQAIDLRIDVPAGQRAGAYSAAVTFTVVGAP